MSLPWQLRLEAAGPLALRLSLKNVSTGGQTYFYSQWLQASALQVVNAKGQTMESYDRRAEMKFDNSIRREDFKVLKPGASVMLAEGTFAAKSGKYELHWGTFVFEDLPPGKYTIQAKWKSTQTKWHDRASGKSGVVSGVWVGMVSSNAVEVVLP